MKHSIRNRAKEATLEDVFLLSNHVTKERLTELRNENEELKLSTAALEDDKYEQTAEIKKLQNDVRRLEMDLSRLENEVICLFIYV